MNAGFGFACRNMFSNRNLDIQIERLQTAIETVKGKAA